jgi:uncharacterized protein (DUF2141 family)
MQQRARKIGSSRGLLALLGLAGAVFLASGGALRAEPAPAKPAAPPARAGAPVVKSSVTVIVEGFHSDVGDALLALYRSKEGFPEQPLKAAARALGHIAQRRTEVTFANLDAGDFAITVMHDEDRNRKLKTGLFGIPSEGVGFSRNALGTFGPPSFDDAKMRLNPAVRLTIKLRMHYY